MALFSFKARFEAPILAGTKRQTIRPPRKNVGSHGRLGGPITLVTGSRFKPRPIGKAVCQGVSPITLNLATGQVLFRDGFGPAPILADTQDELNAFAVRDGFKDWADLCAFWAATHPGLTLFNGVCTSWGPLL